MNRRPLAPQASALPGCATPRLRYAVSDLSEPFPDKGDCFGGVFDFSLLLLNGFYLGRFHDPVLESLSYTLDRVAFLIKHPLDHKDRLKVLLDIDPLAGLILSGLQERELGLPVSEHVRLNAGNLADLADLIEQLVRRIVFSVFGKGRFGEGINWKDFAQPFISGFSDVKPLWQPKATTAFDPKLFVQKGVWPYGKKKRHPTKAIRRAEEAIYEGRFQDAINVYENILFYGYKRNRDFDSYIHHNLASLYLVLCRDEKAKKHFDLKAFS